MTTIRAVPALPSPPANSKGESSISNQTTEPDATEKQPSAITSEEQSVRRYTRIKNPSAQSATSIETTKLDAASKQSSTVASEDQSVRHPTRIKNPPAQSVTSSDNRASFKELRHRTSLRNKKILDDDIPEAHDKDRPVDVDDDSHDDDTHSTSEPPKTDKSTLEILRGHPLFQLPVMNSEFASMEWKAVTT